MQLTHQYAWIVPILPSLAAGFVGLGLISFRNAIRSLRTISSIISIGMLGIAMMFSFGMFWEQVIGDFAHCYIWPWITIDFFRLEVGYLVDPLSAIMLVVVTTVGIVVMIYTDGYMSHDQGYVRFFAYLSLFTASMLGLILSPNLVQIYIFWELVGMCSYLLVGFWFTRPSAASACQKAFITNRVGDFGLFLGILGFYWITGSFDFNVVAERSSQLLNDGSVNTSFVFLCCLLLFLGPVAKSAQFPLHVWLPDAMEGPTPISALIHAATMVAAGIFLVARLLPLFENIPLLMDIIAWTGAITAILGATIALAQRDLKRGLAYSTMSQLGYMMLAMGIGSYQAGLFHLITHAYSKALLFLGAGSVIHGMESVVGYNPNKNQDMRYMGGLRQFMPITGYTFLLGTLSLCGIPPFACFWSKDEILADSWDKMPILGLFAWLTAGLTAFYMFRMYFLTFEGDFRGLSNFNKKLASNQQKNIVMLDSSSQAHIVYSSENKTKYPHESSVAMVAPLVALSVPTCFIGFIGAPILFEEPGSNLLSQWLYTSHLSIDENIGKIWQHLIIESLPSVSIASAGAFTAWLIYGSDYSRSRNLKESLDPSTTGLLGSFLNGVYNWSLKRAYIDELYDKTFIWGTRKFSQLLSLFDQWVIDGSVNTVGLITLLGGESSRYVEAGRVTSYVFILGISTILLLLITLIIQTFVTF
uniref:NAD(P)H-quinone oxidoreductase subunit 5, chloroplastic n=1 Tax=Netrium digitus TaxID=43946 RepID=A0A191T523_9VIRI|nr:subunit 5 of NADH-plastoquinone oxidoreductase [Netrium digitus]ANI25482.1 subunit 5 of NADH-plastoquinone oxidoreductase [Netrium digitus]